MKAIVYTKFGPPDILQLREIEKPTPNDDQVLVKVHATSINAADWHSLTADVFLVRMMGGGGDSKIKIPGIDVAGTVEAVGKNITQLKPGDDVFGGCSGGFAEYACARETSLTLKPANLSYEEAAAVPVAAITALQGLRDTGHIMAGQKVLISGASGGVGSFALQIAKSYGAEVTAVCSTRTVEMARSIGAAHVIDYTKEDFTKLGQRYDLILGINGYHSIMAFRRALTSTGTYVMVGAATDHIIQAMLQTALIGRLLSATGKQKFVSMGIAKINQKDLIFLKGLLESSKVVPVIDKSYPLSETVEGFRYFGEVHPRGKVVITVE